LLKTRIKTTSTGNVASRQAKVLSRFSACACFWADRKIERSEKSASHDESSFESHTSITCRGRFIEAYRMRTRTCLSFSGCHFCFHVIARFCAFADLGSRGRRTALGAAADLEPLLQSTRLHPATGEHSSKGREHPDGRYCWIASFRG
jgi:hypothetical protein